MAKVLELLSDKGTLEIFNAIANNGNIYGQSLQSMNGFSKKQYYSRTQRLLIQGLVKRKHGIFSLTSFGQVVYHSKFRLDAAVKEYYRLKAVDSISASKEMSEVRKEIIENIVIDNNIKMILLGGSLNYLRL